MLGSRLRQHELAPRGLDRKFNESKFLDSIDRLYLILHACMEETCHIAELWDLAELSDGVRTTFKGFRDIYESLVEVFVEKTEEVQSLKNSNRIRYVYTTAAPKPSPADMSLEEIDEARKNQALLIEDELKSGSMDKKEKKDGNGFLHEGGSGRQGFEMDFADEEESDLRRDKNKTHLKEIVEELRKKFEKGGKIDYERIKDPRIILELNSQIYNGMINESRDQQTFLRKTIMEMESRDKLELSSPGELQRLIQITGRIANQFDIKGLEAEIPPTSRELMNELDEAQMEVLSTFDKKQRGLMLKIAEIIKKSFLKPKAGVESQTTLTSKDVDALAFNSNLLLQAPGNDLKRDLAKMKQDHAAAIKNLSELKDRCRAFEDLCTEKQRQVENLVDSVAKLRSELGNERTVSATLRSNLNILNTDLEKAKSQGSMVSSNTTQAADTAHHVQSLVNQLHSKNRELEETKRQAVDRNKAFELLKTLAVKVGVVKGVAVVIRDVDMVKSLSEAVIDLMIQVNDKESNSDDAGSHKEADRKQERNDRVKAHMDRMMGSGSVVKISVACDTSGLPNAVISIKNASPEQAARGLLSLAKIRAVEFCHTKSIKQDMARSVGLIQLSKSQTSLTQLFEPEVNKSPSPSRHSIGVQTDLFFMDSSAKAEVKTNKEHHEPLKEPTKLEQIQKKSGSTTTKFPTSKPERVLEAGSSPNLNERKGKNVRPGSPLTSINPAETTFPNGNITGTIVAVEHTLDTAAVTIGGNFAVGGQKLTMSRQKSMEKRIASLSLTPEANALVASLGQSPVGQDLVSALHSLVRMHLATVGNPDIGGIWRRVGISARGLVIVDERGNLLEGEKSTFRELTKLAAMTLANVDVTTNSGGQSLALQGNQIGMELRSSPSFIRKPAARPSSPALMNSERVISKAQPYLLGHDSKTPVSFHRKNLSYGNGLQSMMHAQNRQREEGLDEESSFKPLPEESDQLYEGKKNRSVLVATERQGQLQARHRHQQSLVTMHSQVEIDEEVFNNSSVITSSQGAIQYPIGLQVPIIPDRIPEHMNILSNNHHEDEDFLQQLYMAVGRPAIFQVKNANFGAVGQQIVAGPARSVEFLHFKKKVKKFVEQHGKCGTGCTHLKKFYERFGQQYVPKYMLSKQSYHLPVLEIGKSRVREQLFREQLIRESQLKKVEDVKQTIKPVFL